MIDWAEFEHTAAILLAHSWRVAKTMPDIPHEYTLREAWGDDTLFDATVAYIRNHGYSAQFQYRRYTYLDIDQYQYWTMGAPLSDTILINRAIRCRQESHDEMALLYDEAVDGPEWQSVDADVVALAGDLSDRSVFDIGCGTGMLLDYANPKEYLGIDPSSKMLQQLVSKFPTRRSDVIATPLGSWSGGRQFDVIVAFFGVGSYLTDSEIERIPIALNPGGRYVVSFYAPNYSPMSHKLSSVEIPYRPYSKGIMSGDTVMCGNYVHVIGP